MKKVLIQLVIVILSLSFISCETYKDGGYLEGTMWGLQEQCDYDGLDIKIVFASTNATIIATSSSGITNTFTGAYTYDHPNVEIVGDTWMHGEFEIESPHPLRHTGTVKERGKTMTLRIQESGELGIICDFIKL